MLVTVALIGAMLQEKPVYMCPSMNNRPTSKRMAVDHGSTRYYLCCDQCVRAAVVSGVAPLQQNAKARGILVADVVFDAASHLRVNEYKAKFMVRDAYKMWLFESEATRTTFQTIDPKTLTEPQRESLVCPACEKTLKTTGEAHAYQDFGDARFYICSKECLVKVQADPTILSARTGGTTPVKTRPVPVPGIEW